MTPAQEVKKRMEGKPTEQVIIELILPATGAVFKRSPPMSQQNAEQRMELYKGATTFTARIVPAEKYKRDAERAQGPQDMETGRGYRSKVE